MIGSSLVVQWLGLSVPWPRLHSWSGNQNPKNRMVRLEKQTKYNFFPMKRKMFCFLMRKHKIHHLNDLKVNNSVVFSNLHFCTTILLSLDHFQETPKENLRVPAQRALYLHLLLVDQGCKLLNLYSFG